MKAIDLKNGLQEIASNPINPEVDIELAEKLIFDFLSQYDDAIKDVYYSIKKAEKNETTQKVQSQP